MKSLLKNTKVADVDAEGLDDDRFFVHLKEGWDFGTDPCQRIGTKSFETVSEARKAVKAAIKDRWSE